MILNDVCIPLKDQVMNSISSINEACVDADIKVCDALIDAYLQNSEAILLGRKEGFVQESKFGDWFQYSEGESIIKTIFLFIPRLIVNLFKQLKAKWDSYVIDKKLVNLKRRAKEFERRGKEIEEALKQDEAKLLAVNNVSKELIDGEYRWCYSTTITDFNQVGTFYGSLRTYFSNYASNCRSGDLENLLKMNDIVNKHLVEKTKQCISDKRQPMPMSPELLTNLEELRDVQKDVAVVVDKSMDEVYHWYHKKMKYEEDDDEVEIDQTAVDRLLKDVRDIRDEYVKIDTILFAEINGMIGDLSNFFDVSEEIASEESQKRRKDLLDALDKNDTDSLNNQKEIDELIAGKVDKSDDEEEGD